MRNVIIVEERFEARGTQRGLALPTAAFADSSSSWVHWSLRVSTLLLQGNTDNGRCAIYMDNGPPASPVYTGVSSRLVRNETRRSVDAGNPEKVAVGMIRPLLTHFHGVVKSKETRYLLMDPWRGQ